MQKYDFFWRGPLSNWQIGRFDGDLWDRHPRAFNCNEQFMMAAKALLFRDLSALESILYIKDPKEQKALGRSVRHFEPEVWENHARNIVYLGASFKFEQIPHCKEALLRTTLPLVEASPYDKVWGIGLEAADPLAQDSSTWKGKNWLGQVLTQLRYDLAQDKPAILQAKREAICTSIRLNAPHPTLFLSTLDAV